MDFLLNLWKVSKNYCDASVGAQKKGHRAVFKWLSKDQNQNNYSDQSQQEQPARWTNHNSHK